MLSYLRPEVEIESKSGRGVSLPEDKLYWNEEKPAKLLRNLFSDLNLKGP